MAHHNTGKAGESIFLSKKDKQYKSNFQKFECLIRHQDIYKIFGKMKNRVTLDKTDENLFTILNNTLFSHEKENTSCENYMFLYSNKSIYVGGMCTTNKQRDLNYYLNNNDYASY